MNTIKSEKKISNTILKSMTIRVTLAILFSSVLSYFHLYSNIKESTIETLMQYVYERSQKESFIFDQAKKSHRYLKKEINSYLNSKSYNSNQEVSSSSYFSQKKDGTYRNTDSFDGKKMAGILIPPNHNLTNKKKKLYIYLKKLAEKTGPILRNNFQDTYFTTPENVMIIYWPEVPNWTASMAPDFNMTKEEYVWIADKEHNPKKEMVWTGVFYDKVGKVWMTSAETPIYKNDQHLLTIGHDITLDELVARAQKDSLPGSYNIIFRKDGRLILHPEKVKELKKTSGNYNIMKSDDPYLKSLYEQVLKRGVNKGIIEHTLSKDLVAFGSINGPNWFFVTIYPKKLLKSAALKTIQYIIIIALLSLLLEIFFIWLVIKKELMEPIDQLYKLALKITNGDYKSNILIKKNNELGALANNGHTWGDGRRNCSRNQ